MAIVYPLSIPNTCGIESIEFKALNAVATSQSPFTYKQQIVAHQGQRWEAVVNTPSTRREDAAKWKAFLTSLRGPIGTFLLSDPDYVEPQGSVSSCVISGSTGEETVTVSMTGSLLAGDYIQLGSGSSARLHQVLQDQTGSGSLEIWPKLRADYSSASAVTSEPAGLFRLKTNSTSWSIDSSSSYRISFECVEAL